MTSPLKMRTNFASVLRPATSVQVRTSAARPLPAVDNSAVSMRIDATIELGRVRNILVALKRRSSAQKEAELVSPVPWLKFQTRPSAVGCQRFCVHPHMVSEGPMSCGLADALG